MSAYTDGPWVARQADDVSMSLIATVGYCGDWVFGPESGSPYSVSYDNHGSEEADARLCAAAPGLLEALKVFVAKYVAMINSGDCGDWDPEDEDKVIAARAAIAKAEA